MRLLEELSRHEDFIATVNTDTISKRMNDRTLILRFLAFYERHYSKCKGGVKRFLNEFSSIYRNPTEDKIEDFRHKFVHSMKAAKTIFGCNAFRLRKESSKGTLGEWTTRVNASVFQVLSVSFLDYKLEQLTRRSDSIYEAYVNLISNPDSKLWVDYTKTSTGDYARIEYVFSIWNHTLKDAIGDCEANDPKRCFSRKLKEKLFTEQQKVCAICSQQISMIEDAEIDHIEHYWKGGKTIPENAQLVHRHCNRTKSLN